MRKYISFVVLLVCAVSLSAQIQSKVNYFKLQDVELLESPFLHAQELNKKYLLELNADRLLAPFHREAGLPQKAESYTNWENTGLDGHIGGHYVSALSLMYASTGDKTIKDRLDYMINEWKRCQDANGNGYIGGVPGGAEIWKEIKAGNIRAGSFDLNGKWVPLYNIHKTYAGLRDAYLYAGNEQAKEILIKMADWAIQLVSQLTEDQIQDMLRSEHGGLNETFADVAAITGNPKYLKLAHQFSHQLILNPLLAHKDELTGMHANTQIPKVLGYKRIADIEGNSKWSEAARFFWETVVENRSVCIGGNSSGEHFHPADDFSRMIKSIEGPETCNTYNMLRLSKMLYQTSLDQKYMEYYERALYNHILSSQHPEKGGFVYFTQMRPEHYRVYSQPHTSFWCCVGSGIENHSKYGEMIYAHTDNELYVNLFIPSRLTWKEKEVEVIQTNTFPDEPSTTLTIDPKKATSFTLQVRYPEWVNNNEISITINGRAFPVSAEPGNYIPITRKWEKGDKVTVQMPMSIKTEQLPDKSNYYAFMYGPVVLAAKSGTEDLQGLFADDSRGGHIAHGKQIPMKDVPILVGEQEELTSYVTPVNEKPLTFSLTNLFSLKQDKEMELIPFFRLHDARYILYWPQATKNEVIRLQQQMDNEEKEKIALDAITIDKVICGEQQPESDHFIQSEQSRIGFTEDVHWREAEKWFSYLLKNKEGKARRLYIKYFNADRLRDFSVLINGKEALSIQLNGGVIDNVSTLICLIPESEQNKSVHELKFTAKESSLTAKITEVRLLENNE